ncbi:PilZ domain-containing protein [Aliivibrio fischeri]|uniref:PilZ domain-containing protein n=1 Tax=Aliivibrio fischeri TaxID=668 RepID=UPI0007C4FC36|nr:PilZ domain-containing protein [Aliivibrio fischeri]
MNNNNYPDNKRLHPRFDVHRVDINIRPKWFPLSKGEQLQVVDISMGGMRLVGRSNISVGHKYRFSIELMGEVVTGNLGCVAIFNKSAGGIINQLSDVEFNDGEIFYCFEFLRLKEPTYTVLKNYIALINV